MNKMISYDKMSKKQKKAYDEKRRVVWAFSPVTRKKESGKTYNRRKARKWEDGVPFATLFLCPFFESVFYEFCRRQKTGADSPGVLHGCSR